MNGNEKICIICVIMSILCANIGIFAEDNTSSWLSFGVSIATYNPDIIYSDDINYLKYFIRFSESEKVQQVIDDLNSLEFVPCNGFITENRNYSKYIRIHLLTDTEFVITDTGFCYLTDYYGDRGRNANFQIIISRINNENIDKLNDIFKNFSEIYGLENIIFDNESIESNIKRSECCSVISYYLEKLAMPTERISYGSWPFADEISYKHYNDINECYNLGILSGTGIQQPNDRIIVNDSEYITKEQMYVMLSRLTKYFINNMSADENLHYDYKLPGDIKDFSDWARDDILFLTEIGLTEPDKNNNLNPKSYVTVEEMKKTGDKVYKYIKRFIDRDMFVTGYAKEYGDKYQIYNWYDYMNRDKGIPKLEYPTEK